MSATAATGWRILPCRRLGCANPALHQLGSASREQFDGLCAADWNAQLEAAVDRMLADGSLEQQVRTLARQLVMVQRRRARRRPA